MAIRNEVLANPPGYRCNSPLLLDALPFSPGDVTAGSEDELQAVVVGDADACDLPITIRDSRFLRNIARRCSSGEAPRKTYLELQEFLSDSEQVWENSWIRFPERRLSTHALNTFLADLKIGERGPSKRRHSDSVKFTFEQGGETWLRIPIRYALKPALTDLSGTRPYMPENMRLAKVTAAGVIVLLRLYWLGLFLFYGRSRVTGSVVSFHVVAGRV
jgi:hypothetical protein